MLRTLELRGHSPRGWGQQHGESFRDDVREIAALRMQLTLEKTDLATRDNVLALAQLHMPILRAFDGALADELEGIAEGAKLTPADIVVLNHYTDLRDLRLSDLHAAQAKDPGGCTAVHTRTDDGVVLGQTWDMHGSAEPYALLMTVPSNPDGVPTDRVNEAGIPRTGKTVLFSITGCLGMTGFTSWGLGLTINNLNSVDATMGAVWSATVRKALRQKDAASAFAALQAAPIGSGRHYMVADEQHMFAMETSGTKKKQMPAASATYVHTNHCIDDEMARTCKILPGSTTLARYDAMTKEVKQRRFADARAVFDAFEVVGLQPKEGAPHDVTTCGALVMNLSTRVGIACEGRPGPGVDALVVEAR
jgi:isopenicillin-N N-acyltransferase like protein